MALHSGRAAHCRSESRHVYSLQPRQLDQVNTSELLNHCSHALEPDYVSDGELLDVVSPYQSPRLLARTSQATRQADRLWARGLARKIDPYDPWLSTRCGSESYAAPELLVAAHTTTYAESPLARAVRCQHHHHTLPLRLASEAAARTHARHVRRPRDRRVGARGAHPPVRPLAHARRVPRRRWVLRVVRGEWAWPAPVGELEQEGEVRGAQLVRLAVVERRGAATGE